MNKKELEKNILKLEVTIAKLTKRLDQLRRILIVVNEG